MAIDLELYRRDARVSIDPPIRLSVIDILPDYPRHILVFLHGYGGYALQWRYQLEKLSLSNRVIAIDLRGHGLSDRPQGAYSMDVIISDIETVLYTLGINTRFYLVGHSFGGAVAIEFAAAHADRIEGLVLVATADHFKLNPLYRLLLKLPDKVLQPFAPLVRNWLSAPPFVMKSWYEDSLARWDGSSLYPRLVMPTMVIRGHLDSVFEKPAYEEVPRSIPGVEEVDVGASGHMVMLERREAVNRAITRFIEKDLGTGPDGISYSEDQQRASLLKSRPWLLHYGQETPHTIAIPRVSLPSLLDSAARRFPNRPATIFEGARLSYRRLMQESNRFANALRSLGIDKGERIILLLPNLPQMVISFFGTLKAGAVAVLAPPDIQAADLLHLLHDSTASVLVTLDEYEALINQVISVMEVGDDASQSYRLRHVLVTQRADYLPRKHLPALRSKISPDSAICDFRSLLNAQTAESPEVEQSARDLAVILYSSGAGTSLKGVMLSHRNLLANTLQVRHWMSDAQEGRERFLSAMPLSHSYGLTTALNVPISLGATILLQPEFEVNNILKTIQRYRPTIFPGVPQMFIAIKDFDGVRKFGVESIRICISSSDLLPIEILESFEKLTRGRLIEGYGLTEASPITHITPLNGLRKTGSIGIPLPSTEARLVDLRKGDREMPPGQIGELAVRGPQVMLGYWQNAKETQRVLSPQGWLLTGDVAQMDSEGYFRIISSKEEAWYPTRADRPASLRAVEEVLNEVPQVKEAVTVVVAGRPVAFVISGKDRPGAETLIAYCKRRLPPELVPRLVIFVEEFPRSYIGKVLRKELTRRLDQQARLQPATSLDEPVQP
jgi:long-chain acyl-CoA synthetase